MIFYLCSYSDFFFFFQQASSQKFRQLAFKILIDSWKFSMLLTTERIGTLKKILWDFADDNIWLAAQNLMDQNPK